MDQYCSLGLYESQNGETVHCGGKMFDRSEIGEDKLRLIKLRSGFKKKKRNICKAHLKKWVTSYASHQHFCCNPLGFHANPVKLSKSSRFEVTLLLRDRAKLLHHQLIPGQQLCIKCKVEIFRQLSANNIELPPQIESSPSLSSSQKNSESGASQPTPPLQQQEDDSPYSFEATPSALESLNTWLITNGEEPIDLSKLQKLKDYSLDQLQKVKNILDSFSGAQSEDRNKFNLKAIQMKSFLFDEMIKQLKTHFDMCETNSDKVLTLSVLPSSWSVKQIEDYFGASNRMIRKAKELVKEKGILCTPDRRKGRELDLETVKKVKEFYYRQDVSKELAGKKNVVSVKEKGARVHKRKRLVLGNISEIYDHFCKTFPSLKVSKTKFGQLRPKECIVASSCGTHNVCVCTIHENPNLMFQGANLKELTGFKSATDCIKLLTCSNPTSKCYLRQCPDCPDSFELREKLEVAFDEEMVDSVSYNQWECADRSNIITQTRPVEEFIDEFLESIENLITHHFTFKTQAQFFIDVQENLNEGEAVVVGDFAENYSCIVQDSVQSYYFSTRQATIHPFSVYYKDPQSLSIKQSSFAIISDHMDHSINAIYTFQKKLLSHLKDIIPNLKKIYYFSDGAGGQYKNKYNAANVWFHSKDFDIHAEWHFFATSHGKSACDGIGGTIKRLATLFCLQHTQPGDQITTPQQLFNYASQKIKGIACLWVSSSEVKNDEEHLAIRFKTANSIEGIKSCHAIVPVPEKNSVLIKRFSTASVGEEREIATGEIKLSVEEVRGFVIYWDKESPEWRLGYVEDTNRDIGIVLVQPLDKTSPKSKYAYQFSENLASWYPLDCILQLSQPSITSRGRVIKIRASEAKAAEVILSSRM